MKSVYLAIPYSHNPEQAFMIANRVAANLMESGHIVFSPITQGHSIAEHLPSSLRTDSLWWLKFDLPFIEKMDELHIICFGKFGMERIEESKGVQAEIKHAQKHNKPIKIHVY